MRAVLKHFEKYLKNSKYDIANIIMMFTYVQKLT